MSLTFCSLFSGSSGNAIYLGDERGAVLIDCGMSGKVTLDAMARVGLDPRDVRAILVTHEHADHIKGVGILSRRLQIPVYATAGTWAAMDAAVGDVPRADRVVIGANESFFLSDMEVVPFPIPHDAAEPVGYRFYARNHGVAVATDLGVFSDDLLSAVSGAELVLLESNHDPDMLRSNPRYPERLKNRILGKRGHLSNEVSAGAAVRLMLRGARHLLLGHLSAENNTPEIAYRTAHAALSAAGAVVGSDVTLHVAGRYQPSYLYRI